MIVRPVLTLAAAVLLLGACSLHAQSAYQHMEVSNGAKIIGTVRCEQAGLGRILRMDRTKDEAICGRSGTSGRLVTGKNGGVQYAVVSLEGITRGKRPAGTTRPVLDQKGCEYDPHILLAPLGSQLEIVNSDPILHNVHAYANVPTLRTLFNIAQPIKGQRTSIKQMQMNEPGVIEATCDAGHPWMSAYIVVSEHPYYTVTDENGHFVLDDVPAGTYKVRLWHEGVRVARVEYERDVPKKYHFEEPYTEYKEVTVKGGTTERVDFEMVLRKGGG